jgi:hypothetical protein
MTPKYLSLAAAAAALAIGLSLAAPSAPQAATADSIMGSAKANRATEARAMRARGCTRKSTCVKWAKGLPGTFVGKCIQTEMQWSCPMKVH